MTTINEDTKKELIAAVSAANRLRADIATIIRVAALISKDESLREHCGFNEGTTLDEQLVEAAKNPLIAHCYDAPMHWLMRSGVSIT